MKAQKQSIGRMVDQPEGRVRFYLFLGPDEGQSRALAARLQQALGATKFVVAANAAKENPALLADEAASLSLFGDRRLIWIEPAGNEITEAVELLLAAESVESAVVGIGGALPKSSALLKLAEGSPAALAFTAYAPAGDDAVRMVTDLGRRVGLKIAPPVAARLADECDNDQAIVGQELEKLALFVGASPHSPRELDHDAIDALGAENGEADSRRLADLALAGEVTALAEAVARLPTLGAEAIPAIRSLHRRLLFLAPARARIERGERIDAVMTSISKTLFWKDKHSVLRMLQAWTAEELARVAERAGELERELLFGEAPEREALGEELMTIARKARGAMR